MDNAIQKLETGSLDLVDCPKARMRVAWLEAACQEIHEAGRGKIAVMHRLAADNAWRVAFGTLRTNYYRWLEHGIDGLVDQRKVRKCVKANEWEQCYLTYIENNKRNNKSAWRHMMDDFHAGKPLPHLRGWRDLWRAEHPEGQIPDCCPGNWIPMGARYENLQRTVKRQADYGFFLAASRIGRKAAHDYVMPVLRTRVGLECGQLYECDDVQLDIETRLPGEGLIARPQAFVCYDIASGHLMGYAMRPAYPDASTGKRSSLKEREFRYLHCDLLTNKGFHRDGTRIIVEHGTTAIRESLEKRIKSIPIYGDLINYGRSGILAEAVHAGLFKGDGGGNPQIKAYCEQAHRMLHSALAMLPGTIGQDADHRPESHAALVRYEQSMVKALAALPIDKLEGIMHGLLAYSEFSSLFASLIDRIFDSPDHKLEGWEDKRMVEFRLSETQPWMPTSKLSDMAGDQREAILAYIHAHPEAVRNRRMSRREAWSIGSRSLIRVPMHEMNLLLDPTDAKEVTVRQDGILSFRDSFYWGEDSIEYYAQCVDRKGFQTALTPGQKYRIYTTPYHDKAVVCAMDNDAVIGVCNQYKRTPYYDQAAIVRAAGAQNHDLATKLLPIRGRHQAEAEQRMAMLGNNADILSGRLQTSRTALSDDPATLAEFAPERTNTFWNDEGQDDQVSILDETH